VYHFLILYHNRSLVIKGYLYVKNYDLNWARTFAGLTQAEAAEKMGVDRKTFNRWETGVVGMPPLRWAKFLKILELSAKDIPPAVEEAVPKYIDGQLSTPYLPMRLQRLAEAEWPAADRTQWAKSAKEDVDGLMAYWRKNYWREYGHDDNIVERATNMTYVKDGWGYIKADGEFDLTPLGKICDALPMAKLEDFL
jgi:transcriptional regulator with XRE-family HTH domain